MLRRVNATAVRLRNIAISSLLVTEVGTETFLLPFSYDAHFSPILAGAAATAAATAAAAAAAAARQAAVGG